MQRKINKIEVDDHAYMRLNIRRQEALIKEDFRFNL